MKISLTTAELLQVEDFQCTAVLTLNFDLDLSKVNTCSDVAQILNIHAKLHENRISTFREITSAAMLMNELTN